MGLNTTWLINTCQNKPKKFCFEMLWSNNLTVLSLYHYSFSFSIGKKQNLHWSANRQHLFKVQQLWSQSSRCYIPSPKLYQMSQKNFLFWKFLSSRVHDGFEESNEKFHKLWKCGKNGWNFFAAKCLKYSLKQSIKQWAKVLHISQEKWETDFQSNTNK